MRKVTKKEQTSEVNVEGQLVVHISTNVAKVGNIPTRLHVDPSTPENAAVSYLENVKTVVVSDILTPGKGMSSSAEADAVTAIELLSAIQEIIRRQR